MIIKIIIISFLDNRKVNNKRNQVVIRGISIGVIGLLGLLGLLELLGLLR